MALQFTGFLRLLFPAAIFAGSAAMRSAPLNASTIFTILATLRLISEPVRMLPEVLSALIQVKVSLDRLDVFLLEDEIEQANTLMNCIRTTDTLSVKIDNGVFSWDTSSVYQTLESIDLNVRRGEKVAIVGSVGAGKSSVLCAILGEIPKLSDQLKCMVPLPMVSQSAWIQSGTIRDSILLVDRNKGFQLARAVYNDADVYLLDDPFSAECVMVALDKKTVLLVTHQIDFLDEVDKILVMEGGQINKQGKYEELVRSGMAFEKLVNAHQSAKIVFRSCKTCRRY
ncbi:putative ABC-type xenobiotic transporter [Dioscorea sansibarensis]